MNVADRQRPAPGELCVDHVAHFVADLDAAARVFESLGMKVTPISVHKISDKPGGTSNRCVMFEEGYIEILSPTHDTPTAQRVRALMRRYDGVHLACYGTPDAEAEHRRLQAHGYEPLPIEELARAVDGGMARFKVVRPAPGKMPEGRIQYVEHLAPEHVWRPAEVNPLRLDEVFIVGNDPIETAARWARFAGLLPQPEGDGVRLQTARGRIFVGSRETVAKLLGEAPPAPAIAGYSLRCGHPQSLAARCSAAGIGVRKSGARYAAKLPAALGGVLVFG
ncbi:MAG TPA: VOC family protein [Burkholderiales bacterium]|jgi:hypothetical protein